MVRSLNLLLFIAILMLGLLPTLGNAYAMSGSSVSATEEFDCVVSGCNGELCVSDSSKSGESHSAFSPCIWQEKFSCYQKLGECQKINGKCGWRDTPDLKKCLSDSAN